MTEKECCEFLKVAVDADMIKIKEFMKNDLTNEPKNVDPNYYLIPRIKSNTQVWENLYNLSALLEFYRKLSEEREKAQAQAQTVVEEPVEIVQAEAEK